MKTHNGLDFSRVEVIANQRGTSLRRTELSKRQTTLL